MEDIKPLLEKQQKSANKEELYIERRKFCNCYTLKCGVIYQLITIIIDFVVEILNAINISENEYFSKSYLQVYIAILIDFSVAVILVLYYFIAKDSPSSRRVVPWALLIAAVVNFLIVLWIASYISLLYPYDKVYVRKQQNNYFNDEELPYNSYETDPKSSNYRKQAKSVYILYHTALPIINGIAYLLFFYTTNDWVERHKN